MLYTSKVAKLRERVRIIDRAELRESFGLDRNAALKRERVRVLREMDRLRARLAEIDDEIGADADERSVVIDGNAEAVGTS